MANGTFPKGFESMQNVTLLEALFGRRSRRFFMGAAIPDGVFRYASTQESVPLSELERLLVVMACSGNTNWHNLIYRAERYAPHLSNYAGAAGGRTFPSAAGFHTSVLFFTDDSGVYFLNTRDAPALAGRDADGNIDLQALLEAHRPLIKKLQDSRLGLPSETPFVEAHNTWAVNKPGTLLVSPVGDLAQHALLGLCYMLQNGLVLYDDVNGRPVPGIEEFADIVDVNNVWPLTFVEQLALSEISIELGMSCYAGALMLQAMGLGGWTFNGIDPFAFLGASGFPECSGLGFRYDEDPRWPYPNVTGLPGVFEAFCPPHYSTMRDAVAALCERKFGHGGPYNPDTPGPWKDTKTVRAAAEPHDERFRACVTLQAQYIFDTFGKFPGTVPSIFVMQHVQAHHLDLDFYDRFYEPGAYLKTHAEHMQNWHGESG
jgi:hypothetical protein